MDFFQHQEKAKSRTFFLVFLYSLGLVGLAIAVAAVTFTFVPDPAVLVCSIGGVLAVVLIASLVKTAQLSAGGGRAVAESLGGRQVSPGSTNPADRRLYNVVEEMALAAGVQVPTIYVMDNEHSINAFAAGFTPNAAVIGVNRGTIELLTRDELQGVIAHEFSHILNGDMRLNMRIIGILFGLQLLALIGYYAMYFGSYMPRSRDSKGSAAGILLLGGIAVMVVGYIGVFFSAIIRAAISRQREFLADASAVQFTRNPDGLAGALKKIGCPNVGSNVSSAQTAEMSHLFFGNVCGLFSLGGLLATHPDLTDRIKRIDSKFDGRFPKQIAPVSFVAEPVRQKTKQVPISRQTIIDSIGTLNIETIAAAGAVLDSIPQPVADSASNPLTAQAVLFAMLLDSDEAIRGTQLRQLQQTCSAYLVEETLRRYPQIGTMPNEEKLPLAQRVSATMREMTKEQYQRFSTAIDQLIAADQKMDLFEYTIKAMLLRDLDIYFGLARQLRVRYAALVQVQKQVTTVLTYLAWAGHDDQAVAMSAFLAAAQELKLPPQMLPPSETTVQTFDQSLRILAETSPALKKQIFSAMMTCVQHDGVITPNESGIIRAVAAMLAIPMPMEYVKH